MLLATGGQELNEKHLTSEQRSQIQNGLNSGKSFKEIGREIGKDCTSVSREIRRNLTVVQKGCFGKSFNDCALIESCTLKQSCDDALCSKSRCRGCKAGCNSKCKQYVKKVCPDLQKPPYVCNSCKRIMKCNAEKRFYNAANCTYSFYFNYTPILYLQ
jgi:transposase, IS30 family